MYEDELQSFYTGLIMVDGDTLCLNINGKDFVLNKETLREILDVPTNGQKIVGELVPLILRS